MIIGDGPLQWAKPAPDTEAWCKDPHLAFAAFLLEDWRKAYPKQTELNRRLLARLARATDKGQE